MRVISQRSCCIAAPFDFVKSEVVGVWGKVSARVLVSPHPVFAENAKITFPSRGRRRLVGVVRFAVEASFPDIYAIPSDKIKETKEATRTHAKSLPPCRFAAGESVASPKQSFGDDG